MRANSWTPRWASTRHSRSWLSSRSASRCWPTAAWSTCSTTPATSCASRRPRPIPRTSRRSIGCASRTSTSTARIRSLSRCAPASSSGSIDPARALAGTDRCRGADAGPGPHGGSDHDRFLRRPAVRRGRRAGRARARAASGLRRGQRAPVEGDELHRGPAAAQPAAAAPAEHPRRRHRNPVSPRRGQERGRRRLLRHLPDRAEPLGDHDRRRVREGGRRRSGHGPGAPHAARDRDPQRRIARRAAAHAERRDAGRQPDRLPVLHRRVRRYWSSATGRRGWRSRAAVTRFPSCCAPDGEVESGG